MNLLAGVLVIVALGAGPMLATAANQYEMRLKNLIDLNSGAEFIETANLELQRLDSTGDETTMAKSQEKKNRYLLPFLRESKTVHCAQHYAEAQQKIKEWGAKAKSYIEDAKKANKGWFASLRLSNPLDEMKKMGNFDQYLVRISQHYDQKPQLIEPVDVDCDMAKFNIHTLDMMLFVIQTDIKHLIIEDSAVVNKAIRSDLGSATPQLNVNHDFFKIEKLNDEQKSLISEYFHAHASPTLTIAKRVKNITEPTNWVIGRLLDSCKTLEGYWNEWPKLNGEREQVCENSRLDSEKEDFANQYNQDKYQATYNLCSNLMQSF